MNVLGQTHCFGWAQLLATRLSVLVTPTNEERAFGSHIVRQIGQGDGVVSASGSHGSGMEVVKAAFGPLQSDLDLGATVSLGLAPHLALLPTGRRLPRHNLHFAHFVLGLTDGRPFHRCNMLLSEILQVVFQPRPHFRVQSSGPFDAFDSEQIICQHGVLLGYALVNVLDVGWCSCHVPLVVRRCCAVVNLVPQRLPQRLPLHQQRVVHPVELGILVAEECTVYLLDVADDGRFGHVAVLLLEDIGRRGPDVLSEDAEVRTLREQPLVALLVDLLQRDPSVELLLQVVLQLHKLPEVVNCEVVLSRITHSLLRILAWLFNHDQHYFPLSLS